jgi:glycerol-3-phosphate O-acyltransferase
LLIAARADRALFRTDCAGPSFFSARVRARAAALLVQLIAAAAAHPDFDVDLVPVAIFWGARRTRRQSCGACCSPRIGCWSGAFASFLNVVFNGRNTVVYFGEPVACARRAEGIREQRSVRARCARCAATLRAQRASTIGPDLSHRRTMVRRS